MPVIVRLVDQIKNDCGLRVSSFFKSLLTFPYSLHRKRREKKIKERKLRNKRLNNMDKKKYKVNKSFPLLAIA